MMTSTNAPDSREPVSATDSHTSSPLQRTLLVATLLILVLSGLIGLRVRLNGLEGMSLATDEYYFVTSAKAVASSGLPALRAGGYYTRGLLPQYLTALFIRLLGDNGLAYRLQAVLFSLVCLPLIYLFGRQVLRRAPAIALLLLLLLSSWAIEFARFARMYSAFQCITLLFLLLLSRVIEGKRRPPDYWLPVVALTAILCHIMGVLFIPLLFLPLIGSKRGGVWPRLQGRLGYHLATLLAILVAAISVQVDFRNWGVSDPLPPDFTGDWGTALRFPFFPFMDPGRDPFASLLLMGLIALVSAGLLLAVGTKRRGVKSVDLLCGSLLAAAVFHQLVIVLACLFLLLGRYSIHRKGSSSPHRSVVLVSCLITIGWLVASVLSTDWLGSFHGENVGPLGAWRLTFLGWPDFYSPIFVPWSRELPVLGFWIAAAVAYQLITKIRRPLQELVMNPAILLVYFLVVVALIQSPYNSTRYLFFVYPLGLLSVALSISEVINRVGGGKGHPEAASRGWLAATAVLFLFAGTADFNPRHLTEIGSDAVTFRTGVFEPRAATWYPRSDFASPAGFLNNLAEGLSGNEKIIVDGALPVSYYLRVPHAIFLAQADERFRIVSREGGTRELWSGQQLLSTPVELREFTRNETSLWVVRSANEASRGFDVETVWGQRMPRATTSMTSVDGRLEVVHIDLKG